MTGYSKLATLTPKDRDALKVLFVARFAPASATADLPAFDEATGVEPRYNFELMRVLQGLGIDCVPTRNLDDLEALTKGRNYVFTIYNRAPFRNGEIFVSLMCEKLGIAYLGAPPNIRAMAEDKHLAKHVAVSLGLPTAPWCVYTRGGAWSPPGFDGPYMIKPRFGAASDEVDIDAVQDDWAGVRRRIEALHDQGKEAIVERCISGIDVTVPVLGGPDPISLGVVEEISDLPYGIATYRQKRLLDKGRVRRMLENHQMAAAIERDSLALVSQVLPFDYLRVDFRVDPKAGRHYFLEFNIGCNLGSHAAIMFAAKNRGLSQAAIIEHILATSVSRQFQRMMEMETT